MEAFKQYNMEKLHNDLSQEGSQRKYNCTALLLRYNQKCVFQNWSFLNQHTFLFQEITRKEMSQHKS